MDPQSSSDFSGGVDSDPLPPPSKPSVPILPPSHPLLNRIQKTLRKQLEARETALSDEIRQIKEAVHRAAIQREEVGVQLFNSHENMAKMSGQLERLRGEGENEIAQRTSYESELIKSEGALNALIQQKKSADSRRNAIQRHVDLLSSTVKQIERVDESLSGDIEINRRMAMQSDLSIEKLEKEKNLQDNEVENIQKSIEILEKTKDILSQKIENQKRETKEAEVKLRETQKAIEIITAENREYSDRWRVSVIGVTSRDEATRKAELTSLANEELIASSHVELKGLKDNIQIERKENEKKTLLLNRLEAETKFLKLQFNAVNDAKDELSKKYKNNRERYEVLEEELKQQKYHLRVAEHQVGQIDIAIEKIAKIKIQLEKDLLIGDESSTTLEKGGAFQYKQIVELKKQVVDLELKKSEGENEVSRLRVDVMTTSAHNRELKNTLDSYDNTLRLLDKTMEDLESEIKRRTEKIEKKQLYVSRLNHKLEQIQSAHANPEDSNLGPMEATIKNLKRLIENKMNETQDSQMQWMKIQTDLVNLNEEILIHESDIHDGRAKFTISKRKKIRLSSEAETAKNEFNDLMNKMRIMGGDINKLNEFIALQSKYIGDLSNQNFAAEQEFQSKLYLNQQKIDNLHEGVKGLSVEKNKILEEIAVVEDSLLQWEKKIEIEKDTQNAIDPHIGAAEISAMKKEIYRLKLKLSGVSKQRDEMIEEMEKAISKNEFMILNVGNPLMGGGDGGGGGGGGAGATGNINYMGIGGSTVKVTATSSTSSSASLRRQIASLKTALSSNQRTIKSLNSSLSQYSLQFNALRKEMKSQRGVWEILNSQWREGEIGVREGILRGQWMREGIVIQQKAAKRLEMAIGRRRRGGGGGGKAKDNNADEKELDDSIELTEEKSGSESPSNASGNVSAVSSLSSSESVSSSLRVSASSLSKALANESPLAVTFFETLSQI